MTLILSCEGLAARVTLTTCLVADVAKMHASVWSRLRCAPSYCMQGFLDKKDPGSIVMEALMKNDVMAALCCPLAQVRGGGMSASHPCMHISVLVYASPCSPRMHPPCPPLCPFPPPYASLHSPPASPIPRGGAYLMRHPRRAALISASMATHGALR